MSQEGGWANPMPAGLVALAMACFVFFALFTGRVTGNAAMLAGIWLLGGFVIQIVVGIIELKEGNLGGGNIFTWFSGFFMLATGLSFIAKVLCAKNGITLDTHIDGWAWIPLAASLLLWTPVYFRAPLYLLIAVLSFDIALPLLFLIDLGVVDKAAAGPIVGWCALLAGTCGVLLAAAIVVNTTYGRNIIPNPGPLVKSTPAAQK